MKLRAFLALLLIGMTVGFTACSDDDNDAPKTYSLEALPTSLTIGADGGIVTVDFISSDQPVSFTADNQSWYSVGPYMTIWHQGAFHTEIQIIVQANVATRATAQYGSSRSANFTATCGDKTVTVTLTQDQPAPTTYIDYSQKMAITDLPEISGSVDDAKAFGLALGLGWNMGNQFDAWSITEGIITNEEDTWGNQACTAATFQKVKEAGFSSVRIPITWMGHIGEGPSYLIEEAYLNRIEEVVGFAEAAGLKVIINTHHDGADSAHWLNIKEAAESETSNEVIKTEIAALWKQIAEKFADKGQFLIFEPFNEIQDGKWGWGDNRTDGGKQYAVLNDWNQLFVNTIRATGGNNTNRYLSVVGYSADPSLTVENTVLPEDPTANRLIVGVHCYAPYNYTLGGTQDKFGHNSGANGEADIKGNVNLIVDAYQAKGIPVYIGEFGCSQATASLEKYRLYYLEYYTKICRENSLACFVWDNGSEGSGMEHHAYINHATGEWASDAGKAAVESMVHGYYTNDPDYTLDWVYASSPK